MSVLVLLQLVHAVVDELELEVVQAHAVLGDNLEDGLVVEQEGQRALCAQAAAELGEVGAHVGDGAGVVVGGGLYEDGDAVGAVALVVDFLVVAGLFVGGFLDGALDGVLGHVGGLGVLHELTQTRVQVGVGTAGLGGDGDFLAQAGKGTAHIAPAFQLAGFAEFKCSSHSGYLLFLWFG